MPDLPSSPVEAMTKKQYEEYVERHGHPKDWAPAHQHRYLFKEKSEKA